MASSGSRKNVGPDELPRGQSFIELSHQELRCVRREGGDEARKGFVGARVVLGHDGLARGADGVTGKVSSEVTKLPLAESRRLLVMESRSSE